MTPWRHQLLISSICFGAFLSLGTHGLRAQEGRPAGVWVLDSARSDTLRSPFRERSDSIGPRSGGEGPGFGRPGGLGGPGGAPGMEGGRRYGGGRYSRGMSDKELERIRQTLGLGRKAPAMIAIDAKGKSVKLTDQQGFETTLAIGGPALCESTYEGGEVCTRARWNDETLVVERRVDGGGRVLERYTLGLGGIRLLSFVSVEGLMQPLEFTRQYGRE